MEQEPDMIDEEDEESPLLLATVHTEEWFKEKVAILQSQTLENAYAKKSVVKLDDLKRIAAHIGMKKSGGKKFLVDGILKHYSQRQQLQQLERVRRSPDHLKINDHHFPRLCNILMEYDQQLIRSQLQATRTQLQDGEVYEKQAFGLRLHVIHYF